MTHHHRHLTRALMIAALAAGAWTAAELADDTAAHAGDKNPAAVAEQPGGVLGHLPEQAADRAREVVDQVVSAEPTPAPEPTRTETPAAPAPADEPSEETEPPVDEPAAAPIVEAPPAEVPPVVVAPPVVEVPPIVEPEPVVVEPIPTTDPIVITLPATDAAPLPDADELPQPRRDQPALIQVTAVALPAPPVLIGPVPAPAAEPSQMEPAAAAAALKVADCAEQPDDAVDVDRDAIRQLIANLTEPASTPRATPAPGCPGTPGHPLPGHVDCTSSTASNTASNTATVVANLADHAIPPALDRLQHARPRSHIPAGRHVAIEPGPA